MNVSKIFWLKMKFPIALFHSIRQLESALPKIEAKCCHEDNQHRDDEYSESSSRHQAIFKSSTHLSHPLALTDTCLDHNGTKSCQCCCVGSEPTFCSVSNCWLEALCQQHSSFYPCSEDDIAGILTAARLFLALIFFFFQPGRI